MSIESRAKEEVEKGAPPEMFEKDGNHFLIGAVVWFVIAIIATASSGQIAVLGVLGAIGIICLIVGGRNKLIAEKMRSYYNKKR